MRGFLQQYQSKILFFVCVSVFLLPQSNVKAQDALVPRVPDPSPNAQALGKYGFIPVSHYTGAVSPSIPLYNIQFEGMEIPLQLNYYSNGLKVAEDASWVGLGWSFSGTALITRQIMDKDDLHLSYGYAREPSLPDVFTSEFENYIYSTYNRADTQADIFVINLFGKTLKFRLVKEAEAPVAVGDETGKIGVQLIDYANYLISYTESSNSFEVVDDNGYKYFFGTKEYTTNIYGSSEYENRSCSNYNYDVDFDYLVPTAWYLDRIESPSGRVLTFEYNVDRNTISSTHLSETKVRTICAETTGNGAIMDNVIFTCSRSIIKHVFLTRIFDNLGQIEIVFNTSPREDLEPLQKMNINIGIHRAQSEKALKLDGFTVKNSLGDAISNVVFSYSYFNSAQADRNDKEFFLRLKLDRVQVDDMEYRFEYEQPESLPDKSSKSFDFWGFYNGVVNQFSFPTYFIGDINCQNYAIGVDWAFFKGGKRGSNPDFAKVGMMTKIIYPTKGNTSFRYEGNIAALNKGNGNEQITKQFIQFNQPFESTNRDLRTSSSPKSFTYAIPSGETYFLWFDAEGNASLELSCSYNCGEIYRYSDSKFRVIDENTNTVVFSENFYFAPGDCNSQNQCSKAVEDKFVLLPGGHTYRFELDPVNGDPSIPTIGLSVSFNAFLPEWPAAIDNFTNVPVGGLRISEQISQDENGKVTETRRYRYETDNDGGVLSTGLLMNDLYFLSGIYRSGIQFNQSYDLTMSTSSTIGIENSAQGSHIGYSMVEEELVSTSASNGIVQTFYYNRPNVTTTGTNPGRRLYAPPIHVAADNGLIKSRFVFSSDGTPLQSEDNKYEKVVESSTTCHKVYFATVTAYLGDQNFPVTYQNVIGSYIYSIPTEVYRLTERESKVFSGGTVLTKREHMTYNDHHLVSEIRLEKSSSHGVNVTEYKYPFDLYDLQNGRLQQENRIANPVWKQTSVVESGTARPTVKEFYRYAEAGTNDLHVSSIERTYGNSDAQEETRFELYDDWGNLLQYRDRNDIPTVFVWSYNHGHIVAKVENATFNEVASALGISEDQLKNFDVSSLSTLNLLRTNLTRAFVTTYEYKPGVGITTKIDPSGVRYNYSFDASGRIERMTDLDGNLIQTFNYNFRQ